MNNRRYVYIRLIVFLCFLVSCRVHKNKLTVSSFNVSFLNGNSYSPFSNGGNFEIIAKELDTLQKIVAKKYVFDAYCPLKNPVQILLSKFKTVAIVESNKKKFVLGGLNNNDSLCNYNCMLDMDPSDKISFKSYINFVPYWHGFSGLGGLSLFMHYHTYKLEIKKLGHQHLIIKWKYSVYKYKPFNKKRKEWSDDYCEDGGGGLVQMKIINKKNLRRYK